MTIPLVKEADEVPRKKTAPWPDFIGAEIREGDTIIHPSGQSGIVAFKPERKSVTDQWVVDYGSGAESRLCLQVGNKGRAIVERLQLGRQIMAIETDPKQGCFLIDTIETARRKNGKRTLSCVVVEDDWPMYDATWKAIEAWSEKQKAGSGE